MVNLCDKIILLGKRTKQNIGVAVIDEFLPKVLQPQPQLVHGGEVVHWVATWFHGVVEQFVATSTAGLFGVCVGTFLEGVPGGSTVPRYARCLALVLFHGNERGSLGREEQDGEQVAVSLLPTLTFPLLVRTSCSVQDEKHLPRVKAHRLTNFPGPLAKVPGAFAFADVVECPVERGGG